MKNPDLKPESQDEDSGNNDLSRRKFLHTAAIAGVAAVTLPIAGVARAGPAGPEHRQAKRMEKILGRYGSEFGDLKRIG